MNIIKLIAEKAKNRQGVKIPTIAFLGDSVTQGCFELYKKNDSALEAFYDKNSSYHNYIAKIFTVLFPEAPINIINAGIGGDSAPEGLRRLERDVLAFNPDLTVVCFGLNDCGKGLDGLQTYADSLRQIFTKLKEADSEVIFMTPNMMNTKISCPIIETAVIDSVPSVPTITLSTRLTIFVMPFCIIIGTARIRAFLYMLFSFISFILFFSLSSDKFA